MESDRTHDSIGAAILGFYAAIKICRREGYDPRKVFGLMNDDDKLEEILGERIYDAALKGSPDAK